MIVKCDTCHIEYDDTYHNTFCPHDKFVMHTSVVGAVPASKPMPVDDGLKQEAAMLWHYEEFIVTTLDDLHAVQEHFRGSDSNDYRRIASQAHVHTKTAGYVQCHTPDISGRLVEGP